MDASTIQSGILTIDWTVLVGTIIVCITILTGIIKIFGQSNIKEEQLRNSQYVKDLIDKINKNADKISTAREDIIDIKNKIELLKMQLQSEITNTDEIRTQQKELVNRLDEFLRQIMEINL